MACLVCTPHPIYEKAWICLISRSGSDILGPFRVLVVQRDDGDAAADDCGAALVLLVRLLLAGFLLRRRPFVPFDLAWRTHSSERRARRGGAAAVPLPHKRRRKYQRCQNVSTPCDQYALNSTNALQ